MAEQDGAWLSGRGVVSDGWIQKHPGRAGTKIKLLSRTSTSRCGNGMQLFCLTQIKHNKF